ncbi:MAG: transcription termination/antitermination factor NusG [Candidatus Margulisbacteria bacterium]|nr:transcription termination/antitermination factor NusG [Candidatus Margulisiibacteriota bacterium]
MTEMKIITDDNEALTEVDPLENAHWFIVQCYTGQEYKVQERINDISELKGYQEKIFRVLVPEEEIIEIKNNKRLEKVIRIFPGYIFVQMIIDDEVFYDIRSLTGVAKFVGSKTSPTPVTEDEILKVLRKVGDKTKKIDIDFEIEEVIKVIAGPFRGYTGPISEINAERGKLKALISIFGRETPVELEFDQVEKTVK